jgi:amino-acid N-acetyltransferase
MMAANQVTHEILEGLSLNNLRAAHTNAIEAVPLGILKGLDHQHTGKAHQVDVNFLQKLLDDGIVPVVPPLGFDGNGNTYRLNSDAVAVEVARELRAVKLMFITPRSGLEIDGRLIQQLSVSELENLLKTNVEKLHPEMLSKAQQALRAAQAGVPRIHVLSGALHEGLLAEVFSNEGVGTLVYGNEYQAIRRANRRDIRHLMALMRPAMQGDQLVKRTRGEIEKRINDYYVFEIDNNICGLMAVHPYPEQKKSELASLQVNPAHENRGIGSKLAVYAEQVAREQGAETLFALSTQAFTFFQHKLGYLEGSPEDLPPARREKYDLSGRRSKVLVKKLG